jgi:N-acetylglutamate synthase-like GNAT family acetyltransferase
MIEIIEYSDIYAIDFKYINEEWLEFYDLMEEYDRAVLNDPRRMIIDGGGAIYLARTDDRIVGTAALINEHNGIYELAKMGIVPQWRGKGISKLLIEQCLSKARALGARKVILFSNNQLTTALSLYERYGFKHIDVSDSPFTTANVKMELVL